MTTVDTAAILAGCQVAVGPCRLVADWSMGHGEATTLEIESLDGERWIAKHIRREKKYRQELHAYREWVPALGVRAPTLHRAEDRLNLLILNRLPGVIAEGTSWAHHPEIHRQAGRLTRLLHDSAPSVADPDVGADLARRLEACIARADGLLDQREIALARAHVAALAASGPIETVPCHLDDQPRNWIVDEDGTVALIDFGHAERQGWMREVVQLHFLDWPDAPDLRDAFFDGYGRHPDEQDWAQFTGYVAYLGAITVVWAHEHNDPDFAAKGRAWLHSLIES